MFVWNATKTAMVHLSNKDIKVEMINGVTAIVASDTTGQYILHTGEGWEKYFVSIAVHLKPVDVLEI